MLFVRKRVFSEMMLFSVKLLNVMGYWTADLDGRVKPRAILLLVAYFGWFFPPQIAFSIRQHTHIKKLLKCGFEMIALVVGTARCCNLVLFNGVLQEAFCDMQLAFGILQYEQASEPVRKMLEHLRKWADNVTKGYLYFTLFQCLFYGPVQTVLATIKYFRTGEQPTLAIIEGDFVFFEHNENFWFWLPVMVVSFCALNLFVLQLVVHESYYWNLLHHVSCLFKMIRLKVLELDDCKTAKAFHDQLALIVELHEVAFKSARSLERSINIMLGVLFTAVILQLCYLMFIFAVIQDDPAMLTMMWIAIQFNSLLIFAYAMLGTEMIEASLSVSDAVYTIRWYERSPYERRLLLMIQMRSQMEASITAGKFFYLTRSSFAKAIRTAFSYFTVIRQFYG